MRILESSNNDEYKFEKIDNGYMCPPSYKIGDIVIEAEGLGADMYGNRYYIGDEGFSLLRDAKERAIELFNKEK